MGQIASFFGIIHSVFQQLAADPTAFNYAKDSLVSEGCNQSHEGLRYVLSKGREPATIELVNQLFYPADFLGEVPDYANLDFANLPEDFEFENKAIYYNNPEEVKNINAFLMAVTAEEFAALFDPDELNQAGVYPSAWNKKIGDNYSFNERSTVQDFVNLKRFFEHIAKEDAYCLVFIG